MAKPKLAVKKPAIEFTIIPSPPSNAEPSYGRNEPPPLVLVEDTLPALAAKALAAHHLSAAFEQDRLAAGHDSLAAGAESGKFLIAAKAKLISEVGHGKWGRWQRDNFSPPGERMAQLYMSAARNPQCVAESTDWADFQKRVAKPKPEPTPQPNEPAMTLPEAAPLTPKPETKATKTAAKPSKATKTYRRNGAIEPAVSPATEPKEFRVCVVDQVMIWYPVKATTQEEATDIALDRYGAILGTDEWRKVVLPEQTMARREMSSMASSVGFRRAYTGGWSAFNGGTPTSP